MINPRKLAALAQMILSLVVRDVTDPEVRAIVAALGAAVAAPSFGTIAALATLIVKRVVKDESDPEVLAVVHALEDLVKPQPAPAPSN